MALVAYRRLKQEKPDDYNWGEGQLNELGYTLMARNRLDDATEILKLNVEACPASANVYDSLSEVYAANGDKAKAILNYEKALSAKKALEELKKWGSGPRRLARFLRPG